MAGTKEKKKGILRKLLRKYRLVLFNESTFEEVGFVRLSRLNLLLIGGLIAIFGIILAFILIAFTPARELIPGYPDAHMSQNIRENAMKLDSLEREIAIRDQYFLNINKIVNGELPEDYLNDTTNLQEQENIIFTRSENEALLRQQVEAEEQFRLTFTDNPAEGTDLHDLHFFSPVRGIITGEFNPLQNHYGVDVVAEPDEVVKSVLDGTVTMATWTLETGWVIQVQHENNLMSVYKHNAELFKTTGIKVAAGDPIAVVGNSGELTTGPHLHFELWHNGVPLDPAEYVVF